MAQYNFSGIPDAPGGGYNFAGIPDATPDPRANGRAAAAPTLAALVRAKYPGSYADLSDVELDARVRAKYPGAYDDLAKPDARVLPLPAIGQEVPQDPLDALARQ